MPSISAGLWPASSMALRTAQVASARVVLSEPRRYVVSPTPTMAYLSLRYFGLVASISLAGSTSVLPRFRLAVHTALRRRWPPGPTIQSGLAVAAGNGHPLTDG